MMAPRVTLVSAMVCTSSLTDGLLDIHEQLGKDALDFQLMVVNDINSGAIDKDAVVQRLRASDVILLDIRGNNPATEIIVETLHAIEKESKDAYNAKTIVSLVGGNEEIRRLTKMGSFEARKIPSKKAAGLGFDDIPDLTDLVKKGIKIGNTMKKMGKYLPFKIFKHARNWALMMDYWVYGHCGIPENFKHMFTFLLKEYLGHSSLDVPPPLKIPPMGIYHPVDQRYHPTLDAYLQDRPAVPGLPVVGIFSYGGIYFEQTQPVVRALVESLGDCTVIPVYAETMENMQAIQSFFFKDGRGIVDAVITLQYFQVNGGPFGGNNQVTLTTYKALDVPQFNPVILFDSTRADYEASPHGMLPINQVIAIVMPELDGRIEMMVAGFMDDLGEASEVGTRVLGIVPAASTIDLVAARVRKWLGLRTKPNRDKKVAIILYDYPPGEGKVGNAGMLDVSASLTTLLGAMRDRGYDVPDLPPGTDIIETLLAGAMVNSPKHVPASAFKGVRLDAGEYGRLFDTFPPAIKESLVAAWGPPPGTVMVDKHGTRLPILTLGNVLVGLQPARSEVTGDSAAYHDKDKPPHHQYVAFYKYLDEIAGVDAVIHLGTHGTLEFLPGKECAGNAMDHPLFLLGSIPNVYVYHVSNTSESAIAKRRGNAVIVNHASPPYGSAGTYQDLARLDALIEEWNDRQRSTRDPGLDAEIHAVAASMHLDGTSIDGIEASLARRKLATIPRGLRVLGEAPSRDDVVDMTVQVLLHSIDVPGEVQAVIDRLHGPAASREHALRAIVGRCLDDGATRDDGAVEPGPSVGKQDALARFVVDLAGRMAAGGEIENVLRALEGRFVEPGFGGDPVRTPSIFPTGRNSYGFDPRLIPGTVAVRRGDEIAECLVQRYKEEHGTWPGTMSVVLWAFETMKTGGETVGQVFNYLGVRAVKHKSVWTTELEVIPLGEMTHPRLDVVITICGIFRDTFPYIVDLINRAIELVDALDEPADKNFLRAARQALAAKGLAHPSARVFGPPPGRYNSNITDIISAGTWRDEQELANDFIESLGHAYLTGMTIVPARDLFGAAIERIDVMSQVRDGIDYHVTDLDHYYEFTGGMAKAQQVRTGKPANVFIADTSSKEIHIDTLKASIEEGATTRTLNPAWIGSMLHHKHHGGQKVAERVENFLGLAATTNQVDSWIWEKTYEQYIENEATRKALEKNNRFAMMDVVKTMLQAEKRGYWKATQDQVDALKRVYLELDSWIEVHYQ